MAWSGIPLSHKLWRCGEYIVECKILGDTQVFAEMIQHLWVVFCIPLDGGLSEKSDGTYREG
jgi:hypothetical protein